MVGGLHLARLVPKLRPARTVEGHLVQPTGLAQSTTRGQKGVPLMWVE